MTYRTYIAAHRFPGQDWHCAGTFFTDDPDAAAQFAGCHRDSNGNGPESIALELPADEVRAMRVYQPITDREMELLKEMSADMKRVAA